MRFRITRPSHIGSTIRELARRNPTQAESYLDSHHEEWEELAVDDPHDAADILEALDEEGAADLLQDLKADEAGDVLDEMHPEAAADVLEELDASEAAVLISKMEVDQAADVIGALEPDDRAAVLAALDPDSANEIERLLVYEDDTAGGMMTTDVASLPAGLSAGEAIEALRSLHGELGSNLRYVYVVDESIRLVGVVAFRDLVFARPSVGLDEIMEAGVVHVQVDTDREVVAELVQRYHLLAIPVVDDQQHLIGMVKVSEAIEAIIAEAGEDINVMVGAGQSETVFTPVSLSVRRRLPWIFFNLIVGFILASLISRFSSTLATYAVLAAYMPIVAMVAGNSGAQSLAVMIRSIAVGDLPPGRAGRAIRREVMIGLVDGTVLATVAAVLGGLTLRMFHPDVVNITPFDLARIVFISVWISFLLASFVGSSIPIALRRLGLDPALASNIFLTMTTDLAGFTGFLLTAMLLLP